jgi:hypothetical protein
MEHSQLVQDMIQLEKLTPQKRLNYAKQRRQQQITNWNRIESKQISSLDQFQTRTNRKRKSHVRFPENIVLLDGKNARLVSMLTRSMNE